MGIATWALGQWESPARLNSERRAGNRDYWLVGIVTTADLVRLKLKKLGELSMQPWKWRRAVGRGQTAEALTIFGLRSFVCSQCL